MVLQTRDLGFCYAGAKYDISEHNALSKNAKLIPNRTRNGKGKTGETYNEGASSENTCFDGESRWRQSRTARPFRRPSRSREVQMLHLRLTSAELEEHGSAFCLEASKGDFRCSEMREHASESWRHHSRIGCERKY